MSLTTVGPGAVQGEIAVLEGGLRRATVRAQTPARLVRIGRDDLFDVLAREPAVLRSLVGTVARRLRDLESSVQEQERLASLGTLAAGLAHELNNPAAAARSSVGQLEAALDEWDRATTALGTLTAGGGPAPGPVAAELLGTLREEAARRAGAPPTLDPLDAADRRDAVGMSWRRSAWRRPTTRRRRSSPWAGTATSSTTCSPRSGTTRRGSSWRPGLPPRPWCASSSPRLPSPPSASRR